MLNTYCPFQTKEGFLREIKGSQVIIPDLYTLFPGWVFNINNNYDIVKKQTDVWLERCVLCFVFLLPSHCASLLISIQLGRKGHSSSPHANRRFCQVRGMFLSRRSGGGVPHNGLLSPLGTALCFHLLLSSLIQNCSHQVFIWDDGTTVSLYIAHRF